MREVHGVLPVKQVMRRARLLSWMRGVRYEGASFRRQLTKEQRLEMLEFFDVPEVIWDIKSDVQFWRALKLYNRRKRDTCKTSKPKP